MFACIKLSFGQTYYPLVDNNEKVWKILLCSNSDTSIFSIDSDTLTIINSKLYKSYIDYRKTHNQSGWSNTSIFSHIYLREDSCKKIYRCSDNNCTNGCEYDSIYEYLLYDFSLEVHDTFPAFYCEACYTGYTGPAVLNWLVISKDSIYVQNSYRKRIILQRIGYNSDIDIWIEGIGSVKYGLIYPCRPLGLVSVISQHTCYFENGDMLYRNPNLLIDSLTMTYFSDSCLTPLTIPYQSTDNSKVYINDGILYVKLLSNKKQVISIYNSLGQTILTQTIQENMQINLKSKGIKNEILFYKITNGIEPIKTGKLILLNN